MNERIKQLVLQAGIQLPNNLVDGVNGPGVVTEKDKLAKFAELIVRECMDTVANCKGTTKFDHWSAIKEQFGVEE